MNNILDLVLLSPAAVRAWSDLTYRVIMGLVCTSNLGKDPPNETLAEVQEDGCLLIQGRVGEHKINLRLPPNDWDWTPGVQQ